MDVSSTQILLVYTLLGLLLAWMVTFTALALRSNPTHTDKLEDLPMPASSTVTHTIASQPSLVQSGTERRHDTSGEMEPVVVT